MFKNYLKTAIRAFARDRTNSILNLLGVAIALAGVLMIAAYVNFELSFDKSYTNSDRIYRLGSSQKKSDETEKSLSVPDPLGTTLKMEFPEVEAATIMGKEERDYRVGNNVLKIKGIHADSSFFQLFNFPFIAGNPTTSLNKGGNMVLTESMAKKLFPGEEAMGKTLTSRDFDGALRTFTVTGIIKDILPNTHFQAEAVVAVQSKEAVMNWRAYGVTGAKYILLKSGSDIESLKKKMPSFNEKYNGEHIHMLFQPVTSIHLHSHLKGEIFQNSDIKYIYIFSSIALLILLIAAVNYINLSIAHSIERVKEIGVRKVFGAGKKQLRFQFITESVLLLPTALPIALLIAALLWPEFASILGLGVNNLILFNWPFLLGAICLSIVTGVLSGIYPAFFLSGMKPAAVLKNRKSGMGVNLFIRKSLIVFQFTIAIGLIISTIVVYKQLYLLNNIDLGYNKDYLISLPAQSLGTEENSFKNELLSGKDIFGVAFSTWEPDESYGNNASMSVPDDSTKSWNFAFVNTDISFLKTMQIGLLSGRDFSRHDKEKMVAFDTLIDKAFESRSNEEIDRVLATQPLILTKTTVDKIGLHRPIEGQTINLNSLQGTIVGEIDDFIGILLLEKNPMVVLRPAGKFDYANTYNRMNSKNIPQTIDFVRNTWENFFPDKTFEYRFMDDQIGGLYRQQQQLSKLFTGFAALAILISLVGLFSLVSLISRQRTKEIGIRKVLGAETREIVGLLTSDFVKLVLISFVIVIPLVWLLMNRWLQDFQYQTDLNWWIFALPGMACMGLALIVVSLQGVRAAQANPVDSLRDE